MPSAITIVFCNSKNCGCIFSLHLLAKLNNSPNKLPREICPSFLLRIGVEIDLISCAKDSIDLSGGNIPLSKCNWATFKKLFSRIDLSNLAKKTLSDTFNRPIIPKSTGTIFPLGLINTFPGCISAWKKPSLKT